jgi:hypothetical protein
MLLRRVVEKLSPIFEALAGTQVRGRAARFSLVAVGLTRGLSGVGEFGVIGVQSVGA